MNMQKRFASSLTWANLSYMMAALMQTPIAYITVLVCGFFCIEIDVGIMSNIASAIYQVAVLLLPFIYYFRTHGFIPSSIRLRPAPISLIVCAVLLAFLGVLLANHLGTWWMLAIDALGLPIPSSSVDVPTTISELIRGIVLIGILPGICEELFFRGMIWRAWERFGTKFSFVISSILFALLHGSLLGFPVQLLMGFVLGYLMLLNQSMYVNITYHIAYNSITLLLAFLSSQNGTILPDAVYSDLNGYISQNVGYLSLLKDTLLTGGVFAGLLCWMRRVKGIGWMPPVHPRPLDRTESISLLLGLLAVGGLWVQEIVRIFL